MAMRNATFHKLCGEYRANWEMDSWGFRDFAESLFPDERVDYDHASGSVMKQIRTEWKKIHKVWYTDLWETYMTVEAMPFGGWSNEKEEADFLKACRNAEKEHKQKE